MNFSPFRIANQLAVSDELERKTGNPFGGSKQFLTKMAAAS
jgi:hypothetical protein